MGSLTINWPKLEVNKSSLQKKDAMKKINTNLFCRLWQLDFFVQSSENQGNDFNIEFPLIFIYLFHNHRKKLLL